MSVLKPLTESLVLELSSRELHSAMDEGGDARPMRYLCSCIGNSDIVIVSQIVVTFPVKGGIEKLALNYKLICT